MDHKKYHHDELNPNQPFCAPPQGVHLKRNASSGSEQVPIPSRHNYGNKYNDNKSMLPIWMRKRDEGRRRRQQQQIPFISGGHYNDEHCKIEVKLEDDEDNEAVQIDHKVKEEDDTDATIGEEEKEQIASASTSSPYSSAIKCGFIKEEAFGTADWINGSDKGTLIMQMMQRMGYEPGRGLGKSQQGILDPIRPVMNPGKLALGAEKVRQNRRHQFEYPMPPTGANGESAKANDGQEQDGHQSSDAEYDGGRAKRMRYEENVIGTLQGVGLCQSDAEEVWQAMGTFAKHGIMSLGMGLGLVKKRAAKARQELAAYKRHCDDN